MNILLEGRFSWSKNVAYLDKTKVQFVLKKRWLKFTSDEKTRLRMPIVLYKVTTIGQE